VLIGTPTIRNWDDRPPVAATGPHNDTRLATVMAPDPCRRDYACEGKTFLKNARA